MANTIRHKRSATAGATPTAAALVPGELAINTADGKLFTEKDDSTVVEFQSKQELGQPNGYAQLDASGRVPPSQAPVVGEIQESKVRRFFFSQL
jgi:hypothetical protein